MSLYPVSSIVNMMYQHCTSVTIDEPVLESDFEMTCPMPPVGGLKLRTKPHPYSHLNKLPGTSS